MSENTEAQTTGNRLEHFPITFFAVVMGMCGLTLASHAGEKALGAGPTGSGILTVVSAALFTAIALIYSLKALRFPAAVKGEWHHPVKLSFFPAVSISLLLLAVTVMPYSPVMANILWSVGAALQGVLTLAVISSWIGTRSFQHGHLTPAWFIPAVGNVVVPVAGMALGHVELSWLFFSAGLMFWVVLLTLVMNRLIFHDPIPGRLQPTLVILIAPPAVGFIAWVHMVGEVDYFARILLNIAYVFTLVVLTQLPRILKLQFALSFWALSFPFAAVTIASFLYAAETGVAGYTLLGFALLALLVVIILVLALRTLKAIAAGKICQPE